MSNQAKASSFQDQEVITPFGEHKVLIKAFPPAAMNLETRAQYLKYVKIDPKKAVGKDEKTMTDEEKADIAAFDSIPASAVAEIKDIAIKHMVLSIDGDPTNVLERVKAMHLTDYNFVVAKIDEIDKATSMTDDEKKDSPVTTPTS